METKRDSSSHDEWNLYTDPAIFQVRATAEIEGWVLLTLETDPESVQRIGAAGTPLSRQDFSPDGSTELASVTLDLRVEEIPHLIAILNEIYRRHHADGTASLEFEPDYEFPRRERLRSGQTLTWPVASRLEPERDPEAWKDRRALLEAYKVVADRLADDVDKLGLLRPIG
jgi:hypothetical protein